MAEILRVGIAGVGTVGASVVRLLAQQDEALQARTGRKIVVTGISARDKAKDRGFDASAMKTTASGFGVSSRRPSKTSRTTASSGERAFKL